MKPLIIVGAGGFAREAINWVWDSGGVVHAIWDPQCRKDWAYLGVKVRKDAPEFNPHCRYLVAIGDPRARQELTLEAGRLGLKPCDPIIHPTAVVARTAEIHKGSIICPQVVVTDNAIIGHHVILNLGVTVGHDSVLHNYVTVSPGANISGNVDIGYASNIGTGSCIREKIKIGSDAVVGMGAVVVKSIADGLTVIGNPAKPKEKKK